MPQCSEHIMPRDRYESFHRRQCTNPATVEHDGKWYCGVHNPASPAKAKRAAEANAKWEAKKRQWRLEAAAPDLLAACKALIQSCAGCMVDGACYAAAHNQARAAIAKATQPKQEE